VSLKDAVAAELSVPRHAICGVKLLREKLAPADLAEFNALLEDSTIFATVISKALKREGHDLASLTLNRHRNRICSCGTV